MTTTPARVLRPHRHLPMPLRRVLEFEVAHPTIGPAEEALLATILHLDRDQYLERLRDALLTDTTSPEERALAEIVRARRRDPGPDGSDGETPADELVVAKRITVNGQTFVAEVDMAEIFLRHAARVYLSGNSDLVLLRHTRGLEMFPITRTTPYDVTDITCSSADDADHVRRRLGLRTRS